MLAQFGPNCLAIAMATLQAVPNANARNACGNNRRPLRAGKSHYIAQSALQDDFRPASPSGQILTEIGPSLAFRPMSKVGPDLVEVGPSLVDSGHSLLVGI